MSVQLAPSILSADFARSAPRSRRPSAAARTLLHLDVMDGHFVPNLTMGPAVVTAVRRVTQLPLDVHLMVSDPDRFLEAFAEAGAQMISVHAEVLPAPAPHDPGHQGLGCRAGVALNPSTPCRRSKRWSAMSTWCW